MSLLDKAIEDSIRKKYIDTAEGENIKRTIKFISSKHGIPEEWIVKMIMIEADGFNAQIDSGSCVGVVQVCRQGSTVVANGGIREVGGFDAFKNIGPAKQLDIWDRYHLSYWLKLAKRKPQTQGELMVLNIVPAEYLKIASGRSSGDSKMPTSQSSFLYTDYDPNLKKRTGGGYWSANSASRGMDLKTEQVLSSSVTGNLLNAANQVGYLAQNAGSVIFNGLATLQSGIQSALLTGHNCPPPPYTQQDRIIYSGCAQKTANPIFGNGLGSGVSAPGINFINNQGGQNFGVGNIGPYTGELKPGGFIIPMQKGSYTFFSGFGWRGERMHEGVDLAAPLGTPIYAAADGVVERIHTTCPVTPSGRCGAPQFEGYGNIVYLNHQGSFTLYAHLASVAVTLGQTVTQGQPVGTVGNSGSSRGEHLHFEVRLSNGKAVDPVNYIKF